MKLYTFISILFIFLFIMGCDFDRGNSVLLQKAENCMELDPDSALQFLKKVSSTTKLIGKERADYCLLMTQAMDKIDSPLKSDSLIQIAVSYYENRNDDIKKGQALFYLGTIYFGNERIEEAQQCYLKAKKILDATDNLKYRALVCGRLGTLYRQQGLYQEALELNLHSVDLFRKANDTSNLSYALRNIGRVYVLDEKIDSASYYYNQAIYEAIRECNLEKQHIFMSEWERILLLLGKTATAEKVLLNSLEYALDKHPVYQILGVYYLRQRKYTQAEQYLLKAVKSPQRIIRVAAYKQLAQLEMRNYNFSYYKRYEMELDSLNQLALSIATKEIQENYDNAHLLAENLQMRNTHLQATLYYLTSFLILLLLSVLLFCYSIYQKRKQGKLQRHLSEIIRNNQKKIEKLHNEWELSQRKIHDLNYSLSVSYTKAKSTDAFRVALSKEEHKSLNLQNLMDELLIKQNVIVTKNETLIRCNRELKRGLDLISNYGREEEYKYYGSLALLIQLLTKPEFGGGVNLNSNDWLQLVYFLQLIYKNINDEKWLNNEKLSIEDKAICCLTCVGVKNINLAEFLAITPDSLTKRKQRIRKKMDNHVMESF